MGRRTRSSVRLGTAAGAANFGADVLGESSGVNAPPSENCSDPGEPPWKITPEGALDCRTRCSVRLGTTVRAANFGVGVLGELSGVNAPPHENCTDPGEPLGKNTSKGALDRRTRSFVRLGTTITAVNFGAELAWGRLWIVSPEGGGHAHIWWTAHQRGID